MSQSTCLKETGEYVSSIGMSGETHRFSHERLPENLSPNRWTQILREVRGSGTQMLDLTVSNPTAAGFLWEREVLSKALSSGEIERYLPSPRGNVVARQAISKFYEKVHGAKVSPENIHLTASTSEAYSWLTKLLCDTKDNVLSPAPSYPLIEHLCGMESVATRKYFLNFNDEKNRWVLDFASLEQAIDDHTRAIFCVSPNNPTGSVFDAEERQHLLSLSRERSLPLVVDEVFLEYGSGGEDLKTFAGTPDAPVFVLGGLSKSAALPQIKLGWIITCGEESFTQETTSRLDFVADTYLSSSTPAQVSVPVILDASREIRGRILERITINEKILSDWAKGSAHDVKILPRMAGWSAIVRLPNGVDEDALSIDLLRRENVIVHPGYFYDLPSEIAPHLVISLLTPTGTLTSALPRIDSSLRRG